LLASTGKVREFHVVWKVVTLPTIHPTTRVWLMWRCLVVVAHQLPRALGMEWDSVGCLHFGLHRSQFSYGLSVNFIWLQFQHSNVSIYCIACRSSCSASLLALTDQHAGAGKPKLKPRFQICLVSPKPSQNQLKTNNQNRNNTAAYTDP